MAAPSNWKACVRNRSGAKNSAGAGVEMETTMAGSVNKVILVGNLGRDPEIKQLPSRILDREPVGRDFGELA